MKYLQIIYNIATKIIINYMRNYKNSVISGIIFSLIPNLPIVNES